MKNNEPIYDEQIAPLVDKIAGICKASGIPVLMRFQLNGNRPDDPATDGRGPLYATTQMPVEGQSYDMNKIMYFLADTMILPAQENNTP